MNNITNSCICEEVIDETSTDYIITQTFGWITGILALIKIFFFTVTLLIKKYSANISWIFVVIGIVGAICAIIFGFRIDELSIYIRGIIMLTLSIIICVAKIIFDKELKNKKMESPDTNTNKDPLLIKKKIENLLKTNEPNLIKYVGDKINITIRKNEIEINSIKLKYNKETLKSLIEFLRKENLQRDIEMVNLGKN